MAKAESWDCDPDLVLPDGPLSLLASDTDVDPETSGSSVSALFSSGPHSRTSSGAPDDDDDDADADGNTSSWLPPGGTLRLAKPTSQHHLLLSSSGDDHDPAADDSFSSNSSSERQSTIKASLLSLPSSQAAAAQQAVTRIDPIVLSVLAAGAKGTVTKLEPSRKPSPIQAGIDWDEDLVMPDSGLVPRNRHNPIALLKNKASFASGISDEVDGLSEAQDNHSDVTNQATKRQSIACQTPSPSQHSLTHLAFSTALPPCGSPSKRPRVPHSQLSSISQKAVDDFMDDFELPSSVQQLELHSTNRRKAPTKSSSSSSSSSSVAGLLLDSETDSFTNEPVPNPSKPPIARPRKPASSGPSSAADDTTPRVRNRPSLTPSLMTDRSSSPFTEADYDLNDNIENFFDDIVFPPEFGIPNNISNSATLSTPTPSTSKILGSDAAYRDSQSSTPNLQTLLDQKVKARAAAADDRAHHHSTLPSSSNSYNSSLHSLPSSATCSHPPEISQSSTSLQSCSSSTASTIYHRGLSSFTSQHLRRAFRAFEDRVGDRVEDGLEIDAGSLRSEKLRSRTNSSISSASQPPPARHRFPAGASGSSVSHRQSAIYQQKRMTVPFPSSAAGVSHTFDIKHTKASYMRSLSTHATDPSSTSSSASSSALPRTNLPHPSLTFRPASVAVSTASSTGSRQSPVPLPVRPTSIHLLPSACSSGPLSPSVNAPTPDSLGMPRFRTKSLRPRSSNNDLNSEGSSSLPSSSTSTTTNRPSAPTNRIKSPLGYASKPGSRPNSRSSLRSRTTPALQPITQPQRLLKHKKSVTSLKANFVAPPSAPNGLPDSSSPGHAHSASISLHHSSLTGRILAHKRSMPALSLDVPDPQHSRSTATKSGRPSSRQQDCPPGPPGSGTSTTSSTISCASRGAPLTALPLTRSSLSTPLATIAGSPDRTADVAKRDSRPASHINSPTSLTSHSNNTTAHVTSRLTMPTIASRLKAKPSLNGSPKLAGAGHALVVTQQLRRPKRMRMYGDGTELDQFDDLPTSKERERLFTRTVGGTASAAGGSSAVVNSGKGKIQPRRIGHGARKGSVSCVSPTSSAPPGPIGHQAHRGHAHQQQAMASQHNRLEARKAEGARRRAAAVAQGRAAGVGGVASRKGLIRQMSISTMAKTSTNTDMRWNATDSRWEGNEHILRDFDTVLSSSARPALITQLSTQSPLYYRQQHHSHQDMAPGPNKAHNHIVGTMVFDAVKMCWRSTEPMDEELLLLDGEDGFGDDEAEGSGTQTVDTEREWNGDYARFPKNVQNLIHHLPPPLNSDDINNKEDDELVPDTGLPLACGLRRPEQVVRFWEEAIEAEKRHSKEVRAWIRSNGKVEEGREYLVEIRKLVMDQ